DQTSLCRRQCTPRGEPQCRPWPSGPASLRMRHPRHQDARTPPTPLRVCRPSPPFGLRHLGQEPDLSLEVAGIFKTLVNTGKTKVRHIVQRLQSLQHGDPDLLAGWLRRLAPQRIFDRLRQLLHVGVTHRPVLACGPHAGHPLGSIERLAKPRSLHHPQRYFFDPLERRESTAAPEALAPAPNSPALFGETRIDDPIIINGAPRTSHTVDHSQGISRCSPGTSTEDPASFSNLCSMPAALPPPTRAAMDASVSPLRTTYSWPAVGPAPAIVLPPSARMGNIRRTRRTTTTTPRIRRRRCTRGEGPTRSTGGGRTLSLG